MLAVSGCWAARTLCCRPQIQGPIRCADISGGQLACPGPGSDLAWLYRVLRKICFICPRLATAGYACLILTGLVRAGQLGAHQLIVHLDRFSAQYEALDDILTRRAGPVTGSVFRPFSWRSSGPEFCPSRPHNVDRLVLCASMIVPKAPPVCSPGCCRRSACGGLAWYRVCRLCHAQY